ncbi:helix-turn-helix domain-containing protein [Hydrogenimonas thermophila]|uniref:Helix-turn-helix domain-containing protein n=1 Tax=Hydrogenimonas thermophila TaxID=223786 RepID=A0A1I5NRU5_9BACT|nr:helix-turn-helix domain-containing protein [Hydrogenimonas thermophila]SFP24016.1 hypothetical protein SAMN05216234_11172 [Hydrogenimonas thermophila]
MDELQRDLYKTLFETYKTAALTRKQAAKVLGISVATLDRLKEQGIGPEYQKKDTPGGRGAVRYPLQAIVSYLTNNNVKTA